LQMQPTFRPEVSASRANNWLGEIALVRPLSVSLLTLAFTAFSLLAAAFLLLQDYTKKARVVGTVLPAVGIVKIVAPSGGMIVRDILVVEGATVRAGDALVVLSAERSNANGGVESAISRLSEGRRESLAREAERQRALAGFAMDAQRSRLAGLRKERALLEGEFEAHRRRIHLTRSRANRFEQLERKGFISPMQREQQQEELLDAELRIAALLRQQLSADREIASVESDLRTADMKSRSQIDALQRESNAIAQGEVENDAHREMLIRAPRDGIVSTLLAERGQPAMPGATLAMLSPEGAEMEVHLFAPSRSIGFIRPGQEVQLRYQAYPYQKFGIHRGTVVAVSKSAVAPAEIPQPMAEASREPVYRIRVALERQRVLAYGEPQPLHAGMAVEADVVLDRRRLIEWVFEPLYSLAGRAA
jgi:membrane fusion protein